MLKSFVPLFYLSSFFKSLCKKATATQIWGAVVISVGGGAHDAP